jgi:hypothetical protein
MNAWRNFNFLCPVLLARGRRVRPRSPPSIVASQLLLRTTSPVYPFSVPVLSFNLNPNPQPEVYTAFYPNRTKLTAAVLEARLDQANVLKKVQFRK